ncbi:MAG: transposase, partial [Acidobacteriota bacterium]
GSAAGIPLERNADLEKFLASLSTAWEEGEVRPTHREKARSRRYWRTRPDPFATVWPRVRAWLDVEPDRTAKELLERLQGEYPGEFSKANLRTLQRRVKTWRADAVRRLVFAHHDRSPGAQHSVGAIPS